MASDAPQPQASDFLSDTELEDVFEREKVFAEELESQTLARLDWMLTRHRAVFLVLAHELGVDPTTAAKLSTAQVYLSRTFSDFVSIGIDTEHGSTPMQHPLDDVINDLVNDVTEPSFETAVETLGPVSQLMNELINGSDEELLHRLERLRPE